jgi:hypothetical protein
MGYATLGYYTEAISLICVQQIEQHFLFMDPAS